MIVEFDPEKDEKNRIRHGLSLEFGRNIFLDPNLTIMETLREGDEEQRFKAIGLVGGKLYTAIHVWRGEVVRLISVRRSNQGEQRSYHRH